MVLIDQIDLNYLASERGLKFVHINARSLFNKLDEVYINYKSYDVIIITETWLNTSIPDASVIFPGFKLIRQDRYDLDNKKGGGIQISNHAMSWGFTDRLNGNLVSCLKN